LSASRASRRAKPLVIIPLHDREALVQPCLDSLKRAGTEYELAIVADAPDFDPAPYMVDADYRDVTPERVGQPTARNIALVHRKSGQDLFTLDSDIEFLTDNWLVRLLDTLYSDSRYGAVTPCIANPGPPWFHGMEPDTGLQEVLNLPVGARLVKGGVVDQVGYFRVFGLYGREDLDYDARIHALGYALLYDTEVSVKHPGIPADERWKQRMLNETERVAKKWEQCYQQGRLIHKPSPEPDYIPENFPRWIDPLSEKPETWGSHLPGLVWAVENTDGPVLELGTGLHSTPYLHGVSERGRLVVSYETDRRWLQLAQERMAAPMHKVIGSLSEVPQERWAVVLNDGPTNDRVKWLGTLRESTRIFVNHDTEDYPEKVDNQDYGWEPTLSSFKYRFDYGNAPRTTLTSDLVDVGAMA
jgi:hypothetical protein